MTDSIDAVIVVRAEGDAKFPKVPRVSISTVAANKAWIARRKTVTANTAATTTATWKTKISNSSYFCPSRQTAGKISDEN